MRVGCAPVGWDDGAEESSAMRHPLFDELEAFHPRWMDMYDTTEEAAKAAGVYELWVDWCKTNGSTLGCSKIRNYAREARQAQAAQIRMFNHYGGGWERLV